MQKTLESKIRQNAVLIYIVVALLCGGMVVFLYNLRKEINEKREDVKQYHQVLLLTNELIYLVNEAQSKANLYVSSQQVGYLRQFKADILRVENLIDSMSRIGGQPKVDSLLHEISMLLNKKAAIMSKLNRQFDSDNPFDLIDSTLRSYDMVKRSDSVVVRTTVKDTVITPPIAKNFWRRLGEVFAPTRKVDTLISSKFIKIDTLQILHYDTLPILSEVSTATEQARKSYVQQIGQIERQVVNLIVADQEISSQISVLFFQLHRQTSLSAISGIEQADEHIRKNNLLSIAGGVIALLLILVFILLIINDVNKGLRARKDLEKANIRTKQTMESRHRLLLSVSHDIKTPLSAIMGNIELWKNKPGIEQKKLQAMQSSGNHILSMLENLLEFSKLEQGILQLEQSNFNLHQFCAGITEMFTPLAVQKGLEFFCSYSMPDGTWVCSDELKLKQIISNLLSNAIKYTAAGKVEFVVDYENEQIKCTICDTGLGISEDYLSTIFEPFSRLTEGKKMASGSGFGLYVVKNYVDLLNGVITVSSEKGKGTRFKIMLPARAVRKNDDSSLKKILVVDDDKALTNVVKNMLSKLGHTIATCNSWDECEQLLATGQFDSILTDMEMGTFSGKDVLEKAKAISAATPVIVMTGRSDFSEKAALEQGFNGYLRKPVTQSLLQQIFGGTSAPSADSTLLYEIFDGDEEMVKDVLTQFFRDTDENITRIRQAISDNNFEAVQAVCHKMLPMFMQLGADKTVGILKKMDSLRGCPESDYPFWRGKMYDLIRLVELFIEKLKAQY